MGTKMIRSRLFVSLLVWIILSVSVNGQVITHKPSDFRGDPNYRRNSNLDGNNIRATIFNSGYSGDPGPGNRA